MLQLPLSEIKRVEALISQQRLAKKNSEFISLSQGCLRAGGIPNEIKQHLQTLLSQDKTDYYNSGWGLPLLRDKLATSLNEKHQTHLTTDNIIISHGSIGALSSLFLTLLEPGDQVLLPEPTYPAYANLAKISRAECRFVSALESSTGHWEIDLDAIKKQTTDKTKMIVFSHPVNPTGSLIPKKTIESLLTWCESKKIYCIIDEVYDDYIFEGNFYSITPYVTQSDYAIRVGSFSKNFSMSGWRIGYMVIPAALNAPVGKTQDALINCPSVPAQHAALYALDHPKLIAPYQEIIKNNRDYACTMLQPLMQKNKISFIPPAAGFNIFFRVASSESSSQICEKIFTQTQVSLVPGGAFGPSSNNYIRLCYARTPDVLAKGVLRVANWLNNNV